MTEQFNITQMELETVKQRSELERISMNEDQDTKTTKVNQMEQLIEELTAELREVNTERDDLKKQVKEEKEEKIKLKQKIESYEKLTEYLSEVKTERDDLKKQVNEEKEENTKLKQKIENYQIIEKERKDRSRSLRKNRLSLNK